MTDDINYNITVTWDDGTTNNVYANRLHNEQLDYWQGWKCTAGATSIYIYESEVYGGECCNDRLGTLGDWELIQQHTTCKLERCTGCTTDLTREKFKES